MNPPPNRDTRLLATLIVLGVLLRLAVVLVSVDLNRDFYWEYGEIAKNLLAGKGYSLYHFDGHETTIMFSTSSTPSPSAFMPPGYVIVLLPFIAIEDVLLRNVLIFIIQTSVSVSLIIAVYFFTLRFFRPSAAIIAAGITALLPEFAYANASYTPTVMYHLGVIGLLFVLYDYDNLRASLKRCALVGLLCAALIFLRSEFILFSAIIMVYLFKKVGFKPSVVALGVAVFLLLPWQVRNYFAFGEWVPLTTSGGLNFFRGHNEIGQGAWSDQHVKERLEKLEHTSGYELERNRIYLQRGIDFMVSHPGLEFKNSLEKLQQFWLFNPWEDRSTNVLYLVPWGVVLMCAFVGAARLQAWRTHPLILTFILYSTFIAVIFFVLPRYQTMMKIVLVPYAAIGVEELIQMYRKRISAG